jgi:hypothetical protein
VLYDWNRPNHVIGYLSEIQKADILPCSCRRPTTPTKGSTSELVQSSLRHSCRAQLEDWTSPSDNRNAARRGFWKGKEAR